MPPTAGAGSDGGSASSEIAETPSGGLTPETLAIIIDFAQESSKPLGPRTALAIFIRPVVPK